MTQECLSRRVRIPALVVCLVFIGASLSADPLGTAFTYQGQLNDGSNPANGPYDFQCRLYDASTAGAQIGPTGTANSVQVSNGVFTLDLDFGVGAFDGTARYLEIEVKAAGDPTYTTLSPRQNLKPAPNALYSAAAPWWGLTGPGPAHMSANSSSSAIYLTNAGGGEGVWSSTSVSLPDRGGVYAVNTGNGNGVYGWSTTGAGVKGVSTQSDGLDGESMDPSKSGVYGHAVDGVGVSASSNSNDAVVAYSNGQYRSGVYGVNNNAVSGYGVTGRSANSFGVYAIGNDTGAGDTTGDLLLGGTYGEIFTESGSMDLYSMESVFIDLDDDNDATVEYFSVHNGTNGNVLAVDEDGNLTIPGNFTAGGSKAGYVVDVAMNDDTVPLQAGDLVAICGVDDPVVGQIPVVKVRRATASRAGAVAGVVDQVFDPPEKAGPTQNSIERKRNPAVGTYSVGPVPPGGYCAMVTLGSFKAIKVDASSGPIRAGDRLVASHRAGFAMKGVAPEPGTIVGKALGALDSGQGTIPVLVTLH
ncbi:hypothetical protein JW916_15000 [Candidatus Sumerlaeota bacterium]|nr:hypothetical protein [Candidatus Sumerlaeota bacterium]